MAIDNHILELIPAYALGSLDEEETILVSEHLVTCQACRTELDVYQKLVDQLALTLPEVAPPPDLKNRLMNHIGAAHQASPAQPQPAWRQSLTRFSGRWGPVWAVASLTLLVLLAVVSLWLWQVLNSGVAVGPQGMQAVSISGTTAAPEGSGFVIIGVDGLSGALVVDRLPTLSPEQEYQVWLIRGDERISGALISVDEAGYGGTRLVAPKPLTEYFAIEVTIEPLEGSPNPTGEVVLSGPLK